jgi:hypothetical protein
MQKTIFAIAALLLLNCANGSPTDPNRGGQGETPDTGKGPSVVARAQDSLLLDNWSMQYSGGNDSHRIIFIPDSVVMDIISLNNRRPTVSHSWYTRAGVLYIENMAGIFTGNAEFTYRIRDTSYTYPGGIRRERWLWLSIINGREDMVPVAARPYTIDCMSWSGRCSNWKP